MCIYIYIDVYIDINRYRFMDSSFPIIGPISETEHGKCHAKFWHFWPCRPGCRSIVGFALLQGRLSGATFGLQAVANLW